MVAAKVLMFNGHIKKELFELFNLDISIDINKSELDERVKILQSKFHPDKYANGSDLEKKGLLFRSHLMLMMGTKS